MTEVSIEGSADMLLLCGLLAEWESSFIFCLGF